ncbi:sulfite exporter TauE/SafE family protein [bacterium]|nr:sulfite exporter TauE/SafE family protein [bacterium]
MIILIGLFIGLLAGYLGIGGGAAYLPVLFYFLAPNCSAELLPKLCVGTSMGAVWLTSIAGTARHWRLGHISKTVWAKLSAGALVGSFAGGYIVRCLQGRILQTIIGAVLLLAAAKMAMSRGEKGKEAEERSPWWLVFAGLGIGLVASTVGIGGGILAVPLLVGFLGMRTERAAGSSAAMTAVLASGAMVGLMFFGGSVASRPNGSIGFVSVKSALLLGVPGAIGALLGAGLHGRLKPDVFKIVFALFLAVVGLKIIL